MACQHTETHQALCVGNSHLCRLVLCSQPAATFDRVAALWLKRTLVRFLYSLGSLSGLSLREDNPSSSSNIKCQWITKQDQPRLHDQLLRPHQQWICMRYCAAPSRVASVSWRSVRTRRTLSWQSSTQTAFQVGWPAASGRTGPDCRAGNASWCWAVAFAPPQPSPRPGGSGPLQQRRDGKLQVSQRSQHCVSADSERLIMGGCNTSGWWMAELADSGSVHRVVTLLWRLSAYLPWATLLMQSR